MKKQAKFKETEIGMIPEDWEEFKLSETIEINPKRELKKGVSAKKIPMDCLSPFNKKINDFEISKFSGGSKFVNGDTIMARITPCLENGKTSFVDILSDGEVGFGSTEFIVLSGKRGKTTNAFVYYLSISPQLRREAIKSMTGTSGRQRVQNDLFEDIKVIIPPIPEQSAIAKILSSLDSKIELNQQMNKILGAIGQTIFKRWFVDFEFPNEKGKQYKSSNGDMVDSELGKIPKGWKIKNVQDLLIFGKGIEPGSKYYQLENCEGCIKFIRVGNISTSEREEVFIPIEKSGEKLCNEYDILLSLDATIGVVKIGLKGAFSSGIRNVYSKEKESIPKGYIYFLLKSDSVQEIIYTYAIGTTILHAGASLDYINITVPNQEIFQKFSKIIDPIFYKMISNVIEINKLEHIRNSLLPKLMSGKIRVPVEVRE